MDTDSHELIMTPKEGRKTPKKKRVNYINLICTAIRYSEAFKKQVVGYLVLSFKNFNIRSRIMNFFFSAFYLHPNLFEFFDRTRVHLAALAMQSRF